MHLCRVTRCVPHRSSLPSGQYSGSTVLLDAGVAVVASFSSPVGLLVYSLATFSLLRTVGSAGTVATPGAPVQLGYPRWIAPAPWSTSTILVPDSSNGRVVEVDVVSGLVVKVWLTGLSNVYGVAASGTSIAVSTGTDTPTTKLQMFSLNGTLLWSVGGTALGVGVTTGAGALLGAPSRVQFSQNGSQVLVTEANAGRVTRWASATGVYLGSAASGLSAPSDVSECWTGAGVGAIITERNSSPSRVSLVSETGVVTSSAAALAGALAITSASLVPGVGVMVVQEAQAINVLSSVAITSHPVNTVAITPATVTFSLTLSANSATTGLTYTWTKGGAVVGNAATYSYTATNADVDAGVSPAIVCTVVHAMGRAVSNPATLTIVRGVTIAPVTTLATVGGSAVTFTATPATGNTVTTYAWTQNGVAVGTNSPTYVYSGAPSHGGSTLTIVCTVTAAAGVASSNTATLTVQVWVEAGLPSVYWHQYLTRCYAFVCLCVCVVHVCSVGRETTVRVSEWGASSVPLACLVPRLGCPPHHARGRVPQGMPVLRAPPPPLQSCVLLDGTVLGVQGCAPCVRRVCTGPAQA